MFDIFEERDVIGFEAHHYFFENRSLKGGHLLLKAMERMNEIEKGMLLVLAMRTKA